MFMHTVNDVERVSDHAVNIIELAQRKDEQRQAQQQEREMLQQILEENVSLWTELSARRNIG